MSAIALAKEGAIYRKLPGYATRSRGTSKRAVRHVSERDLLWADLIFVMEPKHAQRLRASHPKTLRHKKLNILNVPDNYRYLDPQLQSELHDKIQPILNHFAKNPDGAKPPHQNRSDSCQSPPSYTGKKATTHS